MKGEDEFIPLMGLDDLAARVTDARAAHDLAAKEAKKAEEKRDKLGEAWATAERALRDAVRPFVGLLSDETGDGVQRFVGCGCNVCPRHAKNIKIVERKCADNCCDEPEVSPSQCKCSCHD